VGLINRGGRKRIVNKSLLTVIALCSALLAGPSELYARGGGRGGGGGARMGGGGGARMGGGGFSGGGARMSAPARTPSMSRPSMPSYGASRPSGSFSGASRPGMSAPRPSSPGIGASRPSVGTRPGTTRPGTGAPGLGSRPSAGTLPAGGARPGSGIGGTGPGRSGLGSSSRPSAGQLNDFLDLKPSVGGGPASPGRTSGLSGALAGGIAGGLAGGAAADFLRDSGARPSTLPAGPGDGARPGAGGGIGPGDSGRPGLGDALRPGVGDGNRPGVGDGNRPGIADRPLAENRPDRIENREQYRENRGERRDEILDHVDDNPIRDFWADNPGWAAWRLTAPYRWATWGSVAGWVGYGWSEPYPYSYGENVYYADDQVYYGEQPIATAEEYAAQAEMIVESAPEVAPAEAEWMPLGVYALTQDGKASGGEPTLFVQLAISKQGVINGTLRNEIAQTTQTIEGMADKESQRVAWTVAGKPRPIMETGITNLTQDSAAALLHFADGQTQQWLMVRLKDPQSNEGK
jgi:hypothetical protein